MGLVLITDAERDALLRDPKEISLDQLRMLKHPKKRKGKGELIAKVEIKGKSRTRFRIVAQHTEGHATHFGVMLFCIRRGKAIRLIRCNGYHGPHTNYLERKAKAGIIRIDAKTPHIHIITERYQKADGDEEPVPDHYAEPTIDFLAYGEAIEYLCSHYGIRRRGDPFPEFYPMFKKKK